jgi:predicted acyl esterase
MRFRRFAPIFLAAGLTVAIVAPAPAGPRSDAKWTEYYIPSGDGITTLHADVLRPKGISPKKKTPVIMTVSPYVNHSGQTVDYDPTAEGPSERFYDFLDLSNILKRGYTYVMVDLPGTGGSGGCNDWGGPIEQGAVKTAVEWAAKQPWSTGKVGLIGKSYDGWTGLMGMAQKPKGLAAVVSMEPVFSGYRYLYMNGVRFLNSVATPALFQAIDAKPGSLRDDPQYHASGVPQPWCYGVNMAMQQQDEESSAFWAARNLLKLAKRSKTPLFLTQGFLETNTKPDGAFDFFNSLRGPNRAWFGQFDHVRGWEKAGDNFLMGRKVFVPEMMRFFDRHVKGVSRKKAPVHKDPNVAVQDNFGRYRGEKAWPPPDSRTRWSKLRVGTYADNARNRGSGTSGGNGVWTFSQRLRHDVWLAGEPVLKVSADALPRANLVGNLYDVAKNGRATLVSRGAFLLRQNKAAFDLYGQDWVFEKSHRLGILLSGANAEWWTHIPTGGNVTVEKAQIGLPFLKHKRTRFLDGRTTTRLSEHKTNAFVTVSRKTIKENDKKLNLPPRLTPR